MTRVVTGLERLLREGPRAAKLAAPARVGLLAHAASVDAEGRHAIELLSASDAFDLVRIFAPEHGLWGHEQDMETVEDARDPIRGLPVVSLYGQDPSTLRPDPATLAGLDAVLCDLQDVGARYYTFVYTIAHVLEAAAEADVPVVVLDRPNPLGGLVREGPVLSPDQASFVGRFPIPVRHALTAAELARLFQQEFGVPGTLRVVPMEGWRRGAEFESTGLPWVPPSPNMPALSTVRVYPGGCLIEGTELSEGRGTTTPFELVGAPWLDGEALARRMRERRPPDAAFRAASFRPMFQKHAGRACGGVQVIPRGPRFRSFLTYVQLLCAVMRQSPDRFAWRREAYEFESERPAIDLLFGRREIREALEGGADPEELERTWRDQRAAFDEAAHACVLYEA